MAAGLQPQPRSPWKQPVRRDRHLRQQYLGGRWARTSTLIEHWNGAAWKHVASPSPGSTWNTLFGVAADSASDAWAVGWYCASTCASGSAADDTLITHWNGTAWK